MKTRNAVIILTLVLTCIFPSQVKAQEPIRVTELEAPLTLLREIPIIRDFIPKPVEAPKIPWEPPRYPATLAERQQIERILGTSSIRSLTPFGLPGPYKRRSTFDFEDPNLPRELFSGLGLGRPPAAASASEPAAPIFTTKQIVGYQLTLKRLGYNVKVDGKNGPQTRAAVKALQEANGYLPVSSFGSRAARIRGYDVSLGDVKYADGELDEGTVSYLNLIADLRNTARKFYLMDANGRTNALDRAKIIKGYAEYDDHFDIYYAATPKGLTFTRTFGDLDFGILRYYPKSQGLDIQVIDPVQADNEFFNHCKNELTKYTTDSGVFVTAVKTTTGYRMIGPGDAIIDFDARDMRNLRAGRPLSKQNKLSGILSKYSGNLVVWRNPLMKKSSGELRQVEQLAFGLQRAYPQMTVSRSGPDPQKTVERIKAINSYSIRSPDDVLVVLDATSRVTDYKIVDNLRPLLTDAHIPIVEYAPGIKMTKGKDKTVIVITGHINKELNKLVDELCEDGYFAGNYVFLNSCNDPKGLGTKLIDKLLADCGAQAVMRYQGLITPRVVETFLTRMAESVKSGTPINLHDLQLKSISGTTSGIFVAHNFRRANVEDEANQVR